MNAHVRAPRPRSAGEHLEETLVYQDIGLEGREDVPQFDLPLWFLAF